MDANKLKMIVSQYMSESAYKKIATAGMVDECVQKIMELADAKSFSEAISQNEEEMNMDDPHFDGKAYEKDIDQGRLVRGHLKVFHLMVDSEWRTLREISAATRRPEASVSATLRDFRKKRWGSHTVDRKRHPDMKGIFIYRLVPNKESLTWHNYIKQPSNS